MFNITNISNKGTKKQRFVNPPLLDVLIHGADVASFLHAWLQTLISHKNGVLLASVCLLSAGPYDIRGRLRVEWPTL